MKTASLIAIAFLFAILALSSSSSSLKSNETLSAAKLSPAEMKEITKVLETAAFDTPESWGRELLARRISLGSVPGLVLQGTEMLCGGTGNCQLFVFRRGSNHWLAMFEGDTAPVVDGFSFGPGKAHGIADLTVTANSSANASSRTIYRFDGHFYRVLTKPANRQ